MKPHLLLLHGALGSTDQFIELKELLTADFIVHDVNFSGHGGNEIKDDFSTALFIDDTITFFEKNEISEANIFGYSIGGYVALALAIRFPDKVNKIITLGTKFDWTTESATREVKMLDPDVIEVKVPKFAATLQARHHPQDWKTVMQHTAEMMTQLGNGGALTMDDFQNINHEVLICVGSEDNMVSMAESAHVVDHLQKGNLVVIEGFKHPIETVDKTKLAKLIHQFIL